MKGDALLQLYNAVFRTLVQLHACPCPPSLDMFINKMAQAFYSERCETRAGHGQGVTLR